VKIAVLTWSDRRAGGVESYLDACLPELARLGHEVSFWFETSEPQGRARLSVTTALETCRLGGPGVAVEALRQWRPDVILSNGLSDCHLEERLHGVAPTVFVAHNYHGTCISGTKCWSMPRRSPCSRTFGPACLAYYYPRRCGGLSPVSMMRLYGQARTRLQSLKACRRLVVLSRHMHAEYVRHGFDRERVAIVPFGPDPTGEVPSDTPKGATEVRLAFVGRLERLKGADLLVEALVAVNQRLARPVTLTVMGEGSERAEVQRLAAEIERRHSGIAVTFTGWLSPADRDARLKATDLLVVPSVWPEPFGLVGLDAALLGVPAVAFDVGGVRDWMVDGVTGRIARATPPSSDALADAIVDVVAEPSRLAAYQAACRRHALARSPALHALGLSEVLAQATRDHTSPTAA
jgi:glycosyltransferase involved in cell wall biosynthesis